MSSLDNLNESVLYYLKFDTRNALLLTGEWGTGKTHHFKNSLSRKISDTPIPRDDSQKYIPIYISLFGIKSIEDIQTQVVLSLYPILKNKNLKLAAGIVKSVMRGLLQINVLGDVKDYIYDFKDVSHNLINYDQLVLCFDDLERRNKHLDLSEVLGFINSIVEEEGAKVIIIANQDKLEDDFHKELREKVFGNIIEFAPDSTEIFNQIISNRYKSVSKQYYDFLIIQKESIINLLKIAKNNFRTLIFFLEYFREIHSSFIKKLQETPQDRQVKINEKLDSILTFTLSTCIEYRFGEITYKQRQGLDIKELSIISKLDRIYGEDIGDHKGQTAYKQQFKENYFKQKEFIYYESIYSFVTGGKPFSYDEWLCCMTMTLGVCHPVPADG